MSNATKPSDPVALFRQLTSEQIIARLDSLEVEAKGLRVLLRSVRARERAAARRASAVTESEEAHG
jgi:hypothetical protein